MDFNAIPGLIGHYPSSIELIVKGPTEAIQRCKQILTVQNTSAQREYAQLQGKRAFSEDHLQKMKDRMEELKDKLVVECFGQIDETTLSLPPGFWYLCEKVTGHESNAKPSFLGKERYYQKEAVTEALKYKRACIQAATGSGKSVIIHSIVKAMRAQGKRVVVIVPSIELMKQTYKPLAADGSFTVSMLGGGMTPALGCDVLVSTAQSVLSEVDKYQCLLIDETQYLAADSYQEFALAAIYAEHFYCLSATYDRADGMRTLIHCWGGPVVYTYAAKRAIAEGFLSPVHYQQIPVRVNAVVSSSLHKSKQYNKLYSDPEILNKLKDLSEKALAKGRTTLVLFKHIEAAKAFGELMGSDVAHGEYRKPFYDFQSGKTTFLIGTVSLLGVGVDVPNISALLYCGDSSSEISVLQAFGRTVRIAPGKKDAVIVDVYPDRDDNYNNARKRKQMVKKYLVD